MSSSQPTLTSSCCSPSSFSYTEANATYTSNDIAPPTVDQYYFF